MSDEFFIYLPAVTIPETSIGPFNDQDPWRLRSYTGLTNTNIVPQTEKSPFQIGETFLNTVTLPRIITITLMVTSGFGLNNKQLRNLLARSMMVEQITPRTAGERPDQGFLRYFRDGFIPVQLPVIPRGSPNIQLFPGSAHDKACIAELEFFAAFPYWEQVTTNTSQFTELVLETEDQIQFPIEFAIEFIGIIDPIFTKTNNLNNSGDVRTPITATISGFIGDGFSLINNTTGERLDVSGVISTGETVEINTEFGLKSIELVFNSNRTNIMNRVNFETSTFWELAKGINSITFEARECSGCTAAIRWKNRFSGV